MTGNAPIVVGKSIVGVKTDGLGKVGDCSSKVVGSFTGSSPANVSSSIVGVKTDGLGKVGDRLFILFKEIHSIADLLEEIAVELSIIGDDNLVSLTSSFKEPVTSFLRGFTTVSFNENR